MQGYVDWVLTPLTPGVNNSHTEASSWPVRQRLSHFVHPSKNTWCLRASPQELCFSNEWPQPHMSIREDRRAASWRVSAWDQAVLMLVSTSCTSSRARRLRLCCWLAAPVTSRANKFRFPNTKSLIWVDPPLNTRSRSPNFPNSLAAVLSWWCLRRNAFWGLIRHNHF